jgi:putative sterol carrier protein
MVDFPSSPIPPKEFLEEWLPRAFAEADVPPEVREVEVTLGVALTGEGGGEWVFEVREGALEVSPQSREAAIFTFVQTVEDWRGALWEGRGGAIGRQALAMFRPGSQPEQARPGQMAAGAPSPAALAEMQKLNGMIRMEVTGAEGGDWAVAFKVGSGPIPEQPTTTISMSAADAEAMERGELDPMQAFMSGRMRVAGDMTLMMQMQAIQMQVAAQEAAKRSSG